MIPVIERNLASALAKAQTTLLRVHKHRTGTPQYVTAVEWVDLANGQQRWLEYDASGRLKTDTSTSASRSVKATAGAIVRTVVTVDHESKTVVGTDGLLPVRRPLHATSASICGLQL